MDSRLKNTLDMIKLDNNLYDYFESGTFNELKFNKEKKIYSITIALDKPLPVQVYIKTLDGLSSYLREKDSEVLVALYITLNHKNYDNKLVKEYINYYVDCKIEKKELTYWQTGY